jgi:ArsR family transcriptional regulator
MRLIESRKKVNLGWSDTTVSHLPQRFFVVVRSLLTCGQTGARAASRHALDILIFADYSMRVQRNRMPQQLANFKAEFFKALAHPIRIRILDCLRDGEKGVNELSEALQIEQANVSQQLAIMRVRNIVIGRKSGSNVYYSISDRTIFKLLDVAKIIFNNHLVGVRDMLQEIGAAL